MTASRQPSARKSPKTPAADARTRARRSAPIHLTGLWCERAAHCAACPDRVLGACPGEAAFARALVLWQLSEGRSGLPWMVRDPYRRWVSEIMLQQTQVSVVIDYYERFIARFPSVQDLARAPEAEVLSRWSGLGYYARAANLMKAARRVAAELGGVFPEKAGGLAQLPGVGESTAAAVASFCSGEAAAIFDGNVKRVLSRVGMLQTPATSAAGTAAVRSLSQRLMDSLCSDPGEAAEAVRARNLKAAPGCETPLAGVFNQAMMDLGATLCTLRNPGCDRCPVRQWCRAARKGAAALYPVKKPASAKKPRPHMELALAVVRDAEGGVLLTVRPADGIWPGLLCLPQLDPPAASGSRRALQLLGAMPHKLTHLDLTLSFYAVSNPPQGLASAAAPTDAGASSLQRMQAGAAGYFALDGVDGLPLPEPVKRFLKTMSPRQRRRPGAHSGA